MKTSAQGDLLSRRFGLPNPPTLSASAADNRIITFSNLRSDTAGRSLTSIPPEAAYSIHVHLMPTTSFDVRDDDRGLRRESVTAGSLCFFDLQSPPNILFDTPFHTIRSYVPLSTLQEFARETSKNSNMILLPPSCGATDPVIYHLYGCLAPIFGHELKRNSLFVDHVAMALQAHLLQAYGTSDFIPKLSRGGLAAWQEKRAKEMMLASLDKDISITELALECGLSSSHFARAFRLSTGKAPHRWLLERRAEAAQTLLLTSQMPLKEIALASGFTDQVISPGRSRGSSALVRVHGAVSVASRSGSQPRLSLRIRRRLLVCSRKRQTVPKTCKTKGPPQI